MDIRFIAVIFLIAALMEFLGKLARKRREEELEGEVERPRVADPLAGVLEEMRRLPGGDEPGLEALETDDRGVRERGAPGSEARLRAAEPEREPVRSARPTPSRESMFVDTVAPAPPDRVAEPVTPRARIERMFDQMTQPPAAPVVEPEPPPKVAPVVPRRDRSPRPVEARSREGRPREARALEERAWTDERVAADGVPVSGTDGARRRVRARRGAEGAGLDIGSVSGLRRLVVAREVLGPPLALRGEEPFTER